MESWFGLCQLLYVCVLIRSFNKHLPKLKWSIINNNMCVTTKPDRIFFLCDLDVLLPLCCVYIESHRLISSRRDVADVYDDVMRHILRWLDMSFKKNIR